MALFPNKVDNSPGTPQGRVAAADMNALKQEIEALQALVSSVAALATALGGKANSTDVADALLLKADAAATLSALSAKLATTVYEAGMAEKLDIAAFDAEMLDKADKATLVADLIAAMGLAGSRLIATNPGATGFVGIPYGATAYETPGDVADGTDVGALAYKQASHAFWRKESALTPATEAAIDYSGDTPAHSLFPVCSVSDTSAVKIGWATAIRAGLAQGHTSGVVKVVNAGGGTRTVTVGTTTGGATVTLAPGVSALGLGSTAGNELHVWYELTGSAAVRILKFEQR